LSLLFLSSASLPAKGVILAIASGAITSGLGYALWYRVLKGLTSVQSALVQLTVPALASAGGILFLSEPLTFRFVACSALILGGIGIAVLFKTKRV
jgi:drug/metabolite transporter (DMT)-like permease